MSFRTRWTAASRTSAPRTLAQAINYATRDRFTIRVATFDDALSMDKAKILDATVPGVHTDQQELTGV